MRVHYEQKNRHESGGLGGVEHRCDCDRGWDDAGLMDGASYAREGGFVYDGGEFDPGFSDPPATADLENIRAFINDLVAALQS